MTITIDCRMINSSGGISEYLRGILNSMLRSPNDFMLLGNSSQLEFYKQYTNVSVIECDIKPFSLREQIFFPKKILEKINFSTLFYSPSFNIPDGIIIPVYITIHDIIFPDMPELISPTDLAVCMWFYRRAYKKSLIIFTESSYSKHRIEHRLGTKKPVVIPVEILCDEDSADLKSKIMEILGTNNRMPNKRAFIEQFFSVLPDELLDKNTLEKTARRILKEMQ